jgi:hypothetical protein
MEVKHNKILKFSKIVNVGNSCAFDALTFWINLIPIEKASKILELLEPNLKSAIFELTKQIYMSSCNDFYLQTRLQQINNYIKSYYNVHSLEFLSIDNMLFDNEKLLESGYITETFDNFKDVSVQIIHVNKNHYMIKIIINDTDNNILHDIYINDIHDDILNNIYSEDIVLVCNFDKNELNNLCDKIELMCE